MSNAMKEIASGAWLLGLRTPTIPPATSTNTLIVGGDRLAIIEPATPYLDEQKKLDAAVESLQAQGREVVTILLTHHHRDHTGYANRLRERLDVPLRAHAETAARVDFDVDETIEDGWKIELGDGHELEAVFTPGHAPGHLVYLDAKSGVGHAGDLVAGVGTILIDIDDGGDMAVYIDSLRQMTQRVRRSDPPVRLVPAHGPVIESSAELLEHYVAHRLKREEKVVRAIEGGAQTVESALPLAYDDTPRELWPLARMSLEAHLHKLELEGRVAREGSKLRLTQ